MHAEDRMSTRANHLADRIEEGAALLAAVARDLTPEQWATPVRPDGRTAGVIVHHVANMYPIELGVVRAALAHDVISDVTWEVVTGINAGHAAEHAGVTKEAALSLLSQNGAAAARGATVGSGVDEEQAAARVAVATKATSGRRRAREGVIRGAGG